MLIVRDPSGRLKNNTYNASLKCKVVVSDNDSVRFERENGIMSCCAQWLLADMDRLTWDRQARARLRH